MVNNEQEMKDKLIIMYLLDKMEVPLTEDTLYDICTIEHNWISGLLFKAAILSLKETGFLVDSGIINKHETYTLSSDGRLCLSYFATRINASIRDEILNDIATRKLHYKKIQEYLSDYEKNPDGSYTVTLRIENPANLVELKMRVDTQENAEHFKKGWYDKASQVYEFLYDLMLE